MEGTSRRALLKTLAAVPLAATVGVIVSPLVRFVLPTRKPLDLFAPSDQPVVLQSVSFVANQFPTAWTCQEFTFVQEYVQYNPEGKDYRKIPGYAVKLPSGEVVAYSRICPHLGCIFNFVEDPDECAKKYNYRPQGPVFACPCHQSVYDIANDGKVVSGPAPRPPRKFTIHKEGDTIAITGLEAGGIA